MSITTTHYSNDFSHTLCGLKMKKIKLDKKGTWQYKPKVVLLARQVTCKNCKKVLDKEF